MLVPSEKLERGTSLPAKAKLTRYRQDEQILRAEALRKHPGGPV